MGPGVRHLYWVYTGVGACPATLFTGTDTDTGADEQGQVKFLLISVTTGVQPKGGHAKCRKPKKLHILKLL